MSATLNFALPPEMRAWIDQRVVSGQYNNTSEYLRDLVRRDQEREARERLRKLIEEGLASGAGRADTPDDHARLLAIARGEID